MIMKFENWERIKQQPSIKKQSIKKYFKKSILKGDCESEFLAKLWSSHGVEAAYAD